MKFFRFSLLFVALSLISGSAWAVDLYPIWSHSFGDSTVQSQAATAVDGDGNVFYTGTFAGTVDFGGGPLTSAGVEDVFLAKFAPNGDHIWSKRFGDETTQQGWSVAADADGNVIITGPFYGTIDFGGGTLTSAGNRDIYLASFDPDGFHIWSQRFGDSETQGSRSVITDATKSILLTGNFRGVVNFGGGDIVSSGRTDVFLAKFDQDGNHLWSDGFGGARIERGRCVAVDYDRNIVITGYFNRNVNFGSGNMQSAGEDDVFLAKFDPDGNSLWSYNFGDSLTQWGEGVATDDQGNVVLAGYFVGTIDFGGGVLTSGGEEDAYLAKFNSAGVHLWSHGFGDGNNQRGLSTAVNSERDVFLAGRLGGSVDFGGGPLTPGGGQDAFIAQFDEDGVHIWSESFGDSLGQSASSVATGPDDEVLLAGTFGGTINFGAGQHISAGEDDVFLAKFGTDDPTPILLSNVSISERRLAVELDWHILYDVELSRMEIHRATTPRIDDAKTIIELDAEQQEQGYRDESVASGQRYYYWIRALDMEGEITQYGPFSVTFNGLDSPKLLGTYPNPMRDLTTIRFYLPRQSEASMRIYGPNGQQIRHLENAPLDAGTHNFVWDRKDQSGRSVATGTYFYSIGVDRSDWLGGKLIVLR